MFIVKNQVQTHKKFKFYLSKIKNISVKAIETQNMKKFLEKLNIIVCNQ